jgi:hypothetical protein
MECYERGKTILSETEYVRRDSSIELRGHVPVEKVECPIVVYILDYITFKTFHFSFLVHSTHIYLPMKMEQTECSETSAYKLQTPGNYPKESIQQGSGSLSIKCWVDCRSPATFVRTK